MTYLTKKLKKKVISAIDAFNLTKQSEFEFKIQQIFEDSYISESFNEIRRASIARELSTILKYDENLEYVLNVLGYKTKKIEPHRGYPELMVTWDIKKEI